MEELIALLDSIPPPDIAAILHRHKASAARDKKAMILMCQKIERRLTMMGIKLVLVPAFGDDERTNKYKAWSALYGDQETPEVSYADFVTKYAVGQTQDGQYKAYPIEPNT